ncbi:MAG: hypothetical protein HUU20_08030 [Pirellulales bacterium]|nr:hypothetical protein [Pirellulales bacterium]
MRRHTAVPFLLLAVSVAAAAGADNILVHISDTPADGLAVVSVDLTGAAQWCKQIPVRPETLAAVSADGREIPFQFVPAPDYDASKNIAGTLVLKLPGNSDGSLRLVFGSTPAPATAWDGSVATQSYVVRHDAKKTAGLPSRIEFRGTGKVFENFRWQDRAYHPEAGSFRFGDDTRATVKRISEGPLATVIEVSGRYARPDGTSPPAQPEATYRWFYFHDRPLVYVTIFQRQKEPFTWNEAHFLELNFPGEDFLSWAGGEPLQQGKFEATGKGISVDQWAALLDGRNAIGAVQSGNLLLYDGRGGYGTYLHAHRDVAWTPWDGSPRQFSAWLWIGSAEAPAQAVQNAAQGLPSSAKAAVTVDTIGRRIAAASQQPAQLPPDQRRQQWWRVEGAKQLEAVGRLEAAVRAAEGAKPEDWAVLTAGDLGVILEKTENGLALLGAFDTAKGKQLTAAKALPLFAVAMRHAKTKEEVQLKADSGWKQVDIKADGPAVEIRWAGPADERLRGVAVVATAAPDASAGAIRWRLRVENPSDPWSVWRTVFPQLSIAELAGDAKILAPQAAGVVQQGVWQRNYRFGGTYPGGWTSMQFMAAYDEKEQTGLYVATHDPWGSTKDLLAQSNPADRTLVLSFDHPAPDMGVAGNRFELPGEAVWHLLRGDWYDAAVIYRDWVRSEARWYPKLGGDGREDTPRWMRELPAWALGGGSPKECVEAVKEYGRFLGAPVGFHWYSWHQIPFDNDYPHYFPTKDGFTEAVADLQKSGVYVMPYINGRLWDTRDRGVEDFEFTRLARAAATKDEGGEPYLESYSSKESDGSSVKLAAMCPATRLWQDKVREIVLRLMNECGVKGVYIDQVAAAVPRLCFDRSHGHPLGGGHWWTEAYWELLGKLREAMPEGHMLTTECNAEPYIHRFDGYLTWHWQYDGQVPAFPAVYGGAVPMFGRAYRGGPTKDLALRMKAGQQLVYGEQIGWLDPGVVKETENARFFRQVVQLRWALRRYFHAGEMARPPKLSGEIPRVTADWQWHGEWPVTTDAVMAGTWRLPAEKKLVVLAANVGDEPVNAKLELNAGEYGFAGPEIRVTRITAEGVGETFGSSPAIRREVTFEPRAVWAWEIGSP